MHVKWTARAVSSGWEGEPSRHQVSTKVSAFGDSVAWRGKINLYPTRVAESCLQRGSPLCVPLCLSRNLKEGGAPCDPKLQYFPDPCPRIIPTTPTHSIHQVQLH